MSNPRIGGSIDVTAFDKSRFIVGKKGTYADISLIPTPDSQYGNDYMIVQRVSKEAYDAGERGAILGNAKVFHDQRENVPNNPPSAPYVEPPQDDGPGDGNSNAAPVMEDDEIGF